VVGVGAVALLVEGEFAQNRLERTLFLDRLGDFLRIVRTGCRGGLRYDLRRGVGIERIGLRLEAGRTELLDHFLGGRIVARIGTEGVVGTGNGVARDGGELV